MFETGMALIEQGLTVLAQQDLDAIPPVQLGADIKRLRAGIDRAEAHCACRVEAFDRERGYAATPDTSTVNWLRNNCNLSGATADKHVGLARQLPDLGETQKALAAGPLPLEQAHQIGRGPRDPGPGGGGR